MWGPVRSRARAVRALLAWLFLLAGAVAVASSSRADPAAAGTDDQPDLARGAEVYAVHCAACHGPGGQGRLGEAEGVAAGPPLVGLEVALVDQQLRTGRMPIVDRSLGIGGPERLSDEDRDATVAWMRERFELTGEIPEVREGDRARGHELYAIHCAACHGSTGEGGIGAGGTQIRAVVGHDAVAQVAAMRTGPYDMPRFAEEVLSEQDANAIATFIVGDLSEPERTLLWLSESHKVATALLVGLMAATMVGLLVLVGRPVRYRDEEPDTP